MVILKGILNGLLKHGLLCPFNIGSGVKRIKKEFQEYNYLKQEGSTRESKFYFWTGLGGAVGAHLTHIGLSFTSRQFGLFLEYYLLFFVTNLLDRTISRWNAEAEKLPLGIRYQQDINQLEETLSKELLISHARIPY